MHDQHNENMLLLHNLGNAAMTAIDELTARYAAAVAERR
jgi:hypothetical protein